MHILLRKYTVDLQRSDVKRSLAVRWVRAMPFRQDRWPQLRSALRQPVNHVVLVNPFLPSSHREVGVLSSAFRHDIHIISRITV